VLLAELVDGGLQVFHLVGECVSSGFGLVGSPFGLLGLPLGLLGSPLGGSQCGL
jgi:hypothetical protein